MTPAPAFVRRRGPGLLAAAAVIGAVALVILGAGKTTEPLRERLFDTLIGGRAAAGSDRVWVIEVGATNDTGAAGSRADLARLITRLAAAKPAVIGLDIVLSQGCAAGAETDALVQAMRGAAVLTGFVVPGPVGSVPQPQLPIAVMKNAPAWDAAGAETACPVFAAAAAGAVLISLSGGLDGRIRTAPAAAFVAGQPYLGLAVELARRGAGWPTPILGGGNPGWLRLGGVTIPLDAAGQFRFVPMPPARRAAQTLAAAAVLAGQIPDIPPNAVILIGSALPENGGLRASRASPLHPSVHLQADAVEQLLSGRPFSRKSFAAVLEAAVAVIGGGLAVLLACRLPPGRAAVAAWLVAAVWAAVAWAVVGWGNQLLDPLLPAAAEFASPAVESFANPSILSCADNRVSRSAGISGITRAPANTVSHATEFSTASLTNPCPHGILLRVQTTPASTAWPSYPACGSILSWANQAEDKKTQTTPLCASLRAVLTMPIYDKPVRSLMKDMAGAFALQPGQS